MYACYEHTLQNIYFRSSRTIGTNVCVSKYFEHMLETDFGKIYMSTSSIIRIFLYLVQLFESVLATAFGNKLCWFEAH